MERQGRGSNAAPPELARQDMSRYSFAPTLTPSQVRRKREVRKGWAMVAACAAGLGLMVAGAAYIDHARAGASAPTYAVILTAQSGNEYVVDYGMTQEDCSAAIASDWPDASCVAE